VLGKHYKYLNICFNVLLLHCWFIGYILALYDVLLKMFDALMTMLRSRATLVMHMFTIAAFHKVLYRKR